jgi:ribonuclease HI
MKPTNGIAVDGGCSGNPGLAYYRIVDIATNEELVRKDIGEATNNIAEFIGLCHAMKDYPNAVIYSDSITAISWVRKKKPNSSFEYQGLLALKFWLENLKKQPEIRKWETKNWGENPADFGLK